MTEPGAASTSISAALPFGELLRRRFPSIAPARLPTGFDQVGDIAILGIVPELTALEGEIGAILLSCHPRLRVVAKRTGEHQGPFRLVPLAVIAGEPRLSTLHRENGVQLHLDLGQVYFSPRLAHERTRIAAQVGADETMAVLGSGAGPLPLIVARHSRVRDAIGLEINPAAHACALRSLAANRRLKGRVRFLGGDAAQMLPTCQQRFDRIAIALPLGGERLLPCALQALKPGGTLHFYAMCSKHNHDEPLAAIESICGQMQLAPQLIRTAICGHCGPDRNRVCLDVRIDATG